MIIKEYKGILYPFSINRSLGKFAEENDFAAHVRQMMLQVLFTNPGERVNRPDFGCGVKRMVFAPNSEVTASLAKLTIIQSLEKWMGTLINVGEVKVEAAEEKLLIHISYSLKAMSEPQYLNVEVTI